jgi:hypothetical protein
MMSETLVRTKAKIESVKLKLKGISPLITTTNYPESVVGYSEGVAGFAAESVL